METAMKTREVELGVGAPCGLYCSTCPAGQNGTNSHGSCTREHCPSRIEAQICEVYQCCVVERGLNDCAECAEFPCKLLLEFSHHPEAAERIPAILNLQRRRKVGIGRWLAEERHFWATGGMDAQWRMLQRTLQGQRNQQAEIRMRVVALTAEVEMARVCMPREPLPQHA